MASVRSNSDLKSKNAKIFRAIESKLRSDDEAAFIVAAEKVKLFVKKREAYYPEARPLIGGICKAARATLTRLAKSDVPFHCGRPFPPELKARVAAYTGLIETVLKHARTFENDHPLKEELVELFSSVMAAPSQSPESSKQQTNKISLGSELRMPKKTLPMSQVDVSRNESKAAPLRHTELVEGGSMVAPLSVSLENTLKSHTEHHEGPPQENPPLIMPNNAIGMKEATAIPSETSSLQVRTPSTPAFPQQPAASTTVAESSSHAHASPSMANQSVEAQANSSIENSPIDTPTINHPQPTTLSVTDELIPSGNETLVRPVAKTKRKPKLGRTALVNSTLLQEDLNWYSSRQRQNSGPRTSVGSPSAANEAHKNSTLQVESAPVSVVDNNAQSVTKEVDGVIDTTSTSELLPLRSEQPGTIPVSILSDADTTMNFEPAPSRAEQSETVGQPRFLSNIESLPSDMSIAMGSSSDQEEASQHDSELRAQNNHSPPVAGSQLPMPSSVGAHSPSVLAEDTQARPRADTIGIDEKDSDDVRDFAPLEDTNTRGEYTEAMHIDDSRATGPGLVGGTSEQECERGTSLRSQDDCNQVRCLPPFTSTDKGPLKMNGWHSLNIASLKNAPKSIFDPTTVVFLSVNLGQNAGDSVVMDFELAPDQEDLLSLWRTRDQHERDISNSICLSLACYKAVGVLDTDFNLENGDDELFKSALLQLTPSWPTNARLSADIGTFRLFLAPPLQITREKLVDVTPFVDGRQIEIRLDHAGDMRDYIFALVAHAPTPVQLQDLEERRAKRRKFRTVLTNLCLTSVDIFG